MLFDWLSRFSRSQLSNHEIFDFKNGLSDLSCKIIHRHSDAILKKIEFKKCFALFKFYSRKVIFADMARIVNQKVNEVRREVGIVIGEQSESLDGYFIKNDFTLQLALEKLIEEFWVQMHLIIDNKVGLEIEVGFKKVILTVHKIVNIVHHGFDWLNQTLDPEDKNRVKKIHD